MFDDGELDISVVLNYLHEQENITARFYLPPKIHKGNMAKVVYFDERITVRPLSHEEIQVQMVKAGMSIKDYEDNELSGQARR